MAGILSSSPRTRLLDDRYTAFLIMPATLSTASAAAAAAAAVAAVPYSKCVGAESSCLVLSLPENETPAATISIVAHAEAMKRPLQRHPRTVLRPAKLLSIPRWLRHLAARPSFAACGLS